MNKINKWLLDKENDLYINKVKKEVSDIRTKIAEFESLSDEELLSKFEVYKNTTEEQVRKNLVDVYAITTIFISRLFGMDLYDVQLQGAISLFDGNISEMKTGEGKTITSSLPTILNATLNTGSVHVVTVNEYLARRDKESLEPLYTKLGFSTGLNLGEMSSQEKRKAYDKDIVYSTANELGFDYLRDNMVTNLEQKVNRKGYFSALIDEVDLVLIDEARTPLIIGKQEDSSIGPVMQAQNIVKSLDTKDFEVDLKARTVTLTNSGAQKVNEAYGIENIYDSKNIGYMHLINEALLANFIYKLDIDYTLVSNDNANEVMIIDTFTGRLQHGRRYSNGLHQAIEAKHLRQGVAIKEENKTVATITLQNFFRLYKKLSGMSGTAAEELNEFIEIYGLNVIKISPNKPLQRVDADIMTFTTSEEKWRFILERIKHFHSKHDPILIGTVSVEDSELLSKMLSNEGLKHQVLNARQNAAEAEIISKAGVKDAITIATNMAGRGTDIKVDEDYQLVVFLTELNESSRIDNQLKGRTSRQGARGRTETIISLQDSIFEKTHIGNLKGVKVSNPMPKVFGRTLRMVQEELESQSYSARRSALKYDDVIREQRTIFYDTRNKILKSAHDDTNEVVDLMYKVIKDNSTAKTHLEELSESESSKRKLSKEILLHALDMAWVEHIDKLEALKGGIGWRAQTGKNPVITYQNEAQILYEEFKSNMKSIVINTIIELKSYADLQVKNAYANSTPKANNMKSVANKRRHSKKKKGGKRK